MPSLPSVPQNIKGAGLCGLVLMLLVLGLAACAPRPGPEALNRVQVSAAAKTVTVLVATTRQRQQADENVFTNSRALTLNYAEFTISIPPNHKPGEIELGAGDPATSFVTVDQRLLDKVGFEARLAQLKTVKGANVGVFVHGFNTNFQEALFRLAQMAGDADVDGVPVLFAWPSRASVTGYVADRDSVAYSRDYLSDLLTTLAMDAHGGRITLFGHSMGGWLTVETLRELRLAGKTQVIERLNVVLAAPDIDVDVFRTQVSVIGPLKPPVTVLVSKDDRALSFSATIGSERPRVGNLDISDPRVQEASRKYNVRLVDITALPSTDPFRHDRFSRLATLYPQLAAARAGEGGAFVFDTIGNTISAPFTLAGRAFGQ